MRRIISIVVILLVVGYFINSCIQEERKETKTRLEEEAKDQKVRDAVLGLEKRTGASAAWVESLEGERHRRRDPVLTVELERLWLTEKPIVFMGEIVEVASSSDSRYLVTIKRSRLLNRPRFSTELQIVLSAPKRAVDSLLQSPELSNQHGQRKGVAVAARITNIRSSSVLDPKEGSVDIKVGEGELVGVVFTGDARL